MVLGPSTCSALCNTNLSATVVSKVHTTCYENFYSYVSRVLTIQSNPSAHTRYKRQLQMRH